MISIILDANLLLLVIVGKTSRKYIENKIHKKLTAYSLEDFDRLAGLLSNAPKIIVSPNTLTEVSNHADWVAEPARSKIAETFRQFVHAPHGTEERVVTSAQAVNRAEFLRLGLTDSVLLELASKKSMILTTDLDLYLAALKAGYQATNFNHLRAL